MDLIFILGAGFSRAVGARMPLMRDLSDLVFERVELPDAKKFLLTFGADIESAMTYLAQDHPWLSAPDNLRNRAAFLELASAVKDVLIDAMKETARSDCPEWLLQLVGFWTKTHSQILSLNYDTLPESAARLCKSLHASGLWPAFYYPFSMPPVDPNRDLFSFDVWESNPAFMLYKLHGSINWLYSGDTLSGEKTIYHAGLDDLWGGVGFAMPPPRYKHSDKHPLIVPPVAEKGGYLRHPQLTGMWRDAAAAVRRATRIYCLGYSMPTTDTTMQFFLWRNQPAEGTKFFLVDVEDRREHFGQMLRQSGFDFDAEFIRADDPIPRFVDCLVGDTCID